MSILLYLKDCGLNNLSKVFKTKLEKIEKEKERKMTYFQKSFPREK